METGAYKPIKSLWTQNDFDQMSWHDNRLHGIGIIDDFNPHEHEVRFDIDYIFEWAGHNNKPGTAGFWIAPSTLVFPASSMSIGIDHLRGYWIMEIERSNPVKIHEGRCIEWTWKVSLNTGGLITLNASEFFQYTRQAPIFLPCPDQCLESRQRGGISFDKRLYDQ
jgi:hypothetical protein